MYEHLLQQLEEVVLAMSAEDLGKAPQTKIQLAVRDELYSLGMDRSYADLFTMRMPVDITVDLTDEQTDRLVAVVRHLVNVAYTAMNSMGFNDEAIAEAARSMNFNFS